MRIDGTREHPLQVSIRRLAVLSWLWSSFETGRVHNPCSYKTIRFYGTGSPDRLTNHVDKAKIGTPAAFNGSENAASTPTRPRMCLHSSDKQVSLRLTMFHRTLDFDTCPIALPLVLIGHAFVAFADNGKLVLCFGDRNEASLVAAQGFKNMGRDGTASSQLDHKEGIIRNMKVKRGAV
jgi:hypothetical protein